MEGEASRRLNPHAAPFYPSRFHHYREADRPPLPPPPPRKPSLPHSLAPLPAGPRNASCRFSRRRGLPAVSNNNGGTKFREITPLNRQDSSTTVMIRNIPNNYTRDLLMEFLDTHCKQENEKEAQTVKSEFDFLYLPVDFKHRLNAGYAFVNFTSSEAAWRFHTCIKGKHWELFQSKKIADVTRAKIQGKEALVKNFERMKLCSPSSDYLPVWFEPPRDGCSSSSATKMHAIGQVKDRER